MPLKIPHSWLADLAQEQEKPYFHTLERFVDEERAQYAVFPAEEDVFNALAYTPLESVRVVLLGQDPYPTRGHAHGLCFSVLQGVALPKSLRNIYTELQIDVGFVPPNHGYLASWAGQGVLMLNAVLTVREGETNSHQNRGWETFTDAVLAQVIAKPKPVIFLLWGNYAKRKTSLIETAGRGHIVLSTGHPSPLSVKHFRGCRHFSKVNALLEAWGEPPIVWQLPHSPAL